MRQNYTPSRSPETQDSVEEQETGKARDAQGDRLSGIIPRRQAQWALRDTRLKRDHRHVQSSAQTWRVNRRDPEIE